MKKFFKSASILAIASSLVIPTTVLASSFDSQVNNLTGGARDYISQFQGLNFQEMVANSQASDIAAFSSMYEGSKENLNLLYDAHKSNINSKLSASLDIYEGLKSGLNGEMKDGIGNLKSQYDSNKTTLNDGIQGKIAQEENNYKAKDNKYASEYGKNKNKGSLYIAPSSSGYKLSSPISTYNSPTLENPGDMKYNEALSKVHAPARDLKQAAQTRVDPNHMGDSITTAQDFIGKTRENIHKKDPTVVDKILNGGKKLKELIQKH